MEGGREGKNNDLFWERELRRDLFSLSLCLSCKLAPFHPCSLLHPTSRSLREREREEKKRYQRFFPLLSIVLTKENLSLSLSFLLFLQPLRLGAKEGKKHSLMGQKYSLFSIISLFFLPLKVFVFSKVAHKECKKGGGEEKCKKTEQKKIEREREREILSPQKKVLSNFASRFFFPLFSLLYPKREKRGDK